MQQVTFITDKPDSRPVILRQEFNHAFYSKKIFWWEPHPWGEKSIFNLFDKTVLKDHLLKGAFLIVDFYGDAPYIDFAEEVYLKDLLDFFKHHKIPSSQLIVISCAPNDLFFYHSLGFKVVRGYHHIFFNPLWFQYQRDYIRNPFTSPDKNIEKLFMLLMRKDSQPRRLFNYLCHYHGIHDLGFVSHNMVSYLNEDSTFNTKSYTSKPSFDSDLYFDFSTRKHLVEENPPMPHVNENFYETYSLPVELSYKSFVEIIVEQGNLDKMMITEKVFKAFLTKNIFILYNTPGSIKYLKELGFKTFSNVFDESYDTIIDDYDRAEFIVKEVKRFSKLSLSSLKNIYKECEDIVNHNYDHFVNQDWLFNLSDEIENYVSSDFC